MLKFLLADKISTRLEFAFGLVCAWWYNTASTNSMVRILMTQAESEGRTACQILSLEYLDFTKWFYNKAGSRGFS